MTLYDDISARITGRLAIRREEADVLEFLLKGQAGLHVEIGTLWGGTAILAALAKGKGKVITIDYMQGGYWDTGDPDVVNHPRPSMQAIMDNLIRFKVDRMVDVIKAPSHPWPLDGKQKPVSILIDGGHDYESCSRDWLNAKEIARQYVIFHDYNNAAVLGYDPHPGVYRAVNYGPKQCPEWQLHGVYGTLAVFERA